MAQYRNPNNPSETCRKSKCRSKTSAQSFDITEERYVLRVRLQDRDVELFPYCEQYWDTSPAAACGRDPQRDEVVRHIMLVPKYKELNGEAEQEGRESSYWDHNGSIMYLVVHGDRRQFFYHKPRGGMVKAGAEEDSLLFGGETDGKTYEGTAFIFNKRCGQYPYCATGPVLDGGSRVILRGKAPRVDGDCKVYSYRDDELEFTLLPNR